MYKLDDKTKRRLYEINQKFCKKDLLSEDEKREYLGLMPRKK